MNQKQIEQKRLKSRAKIQIQVELMRSGNNPRSTWDLWFTVDIKPEFEGVLTESEVERYLYQKARLKDPSVTRLGKGMYARI